MSSGLAAATACVVLCAALGVSSQAATAVDRYPSGAMQGGIAVQADDDSLLAGVQVFVQGGLDRETSAHNGLSALVAELVARTPVGAGARPLREAIWSLGGGLTTTVEPQDVRFYVEGRPAAVAAALALLGSALAAPDFSPAALANAKAALRGRIAETDQSPFGVVATMLRGAYYVGSAAGLSPAGSAEVVAGVGPGDVRAFWEKYYRRGGASLAAAGRIDGSVLAAAHGALDRLPPGDVSAIVLRVKSLGDPPERIVTHRDVGVPWIGLGFAAPAPGAADFAPMLVVQAIVAALGRESWITTPPPALRSINVVYQYSLRPSNFIVYANGDSADATAGAREVFAVTELLARQSLDETVLRRYRNLAIGNFVTDTMTLEERAGLVGSFALQGLGADYPNAVLDLLGKVSPADVQRVAKRYLAKYAVAIVLPRTETPKN